MSAQDLIAVALGVAAALALLRRVVRRRGAATCCGKPTCPAAESLVARFRAPNRMEELT